MTYNTTPITSGAAKFSTLDPDAPLFLEENDITVGANPENPATLYDYDTSTLNISHIVGNNGALDLSNSDLIGVKQFVCADYLGSIKCTASNNLKWTITLNNAGATYSKQFKTPNNIITSTVKMSIYATNTASVSRTISLEKYDPNTSTYTPVTTFTIAGNKTTPTQITSSNNITINAGEIYAFKGDSFATFVGSSGVGVLCDVETIGEGLWIVL